MLLPEGQKLWAGSPFAYRELKTLIPYTFAPKQGKGRAIALSLIRSGLA